MIKTTASKRRRLALPMLLLPWVEPIKPSIIAAGAKKKIDDDNAPTLEILPSKPAIELTKTKLADSPDDWRVSAHPITSKSGERKIPPPVPVNPESKPIAAPERSAAQSGIVFIRIF